MTEGSVQPADGLGETTAGPVSPATGGDIRDDEVDAAVVRLGELDRLTPAEQVGVYEDVQRRLAGVLERDADLGES
jgi:hypothetical protein